MPVISRFFGIAIRMHVRDHAPPHFHAVYGEHEAAFEIADGELLAGSLPPTARRLVHEWADLHRAELADNWERAQAGEPLLPIEGLDAD